MRITVRAIYNWIYPHNNEAFARMSAAVIKGEFSSPRSLKRFLRKAGLKIGEGHGIRILNGRWDQDHDIISQHSGERVGKMGLSGKIERHT